MRRPRLISQTAVRALTYTLLAGAVLALFLVACDPGPTHIEPPPTGDISITVTVIGDGRATFESNGFTCSSTCTLMIDAGADISLAAVPDAGRELVAWEGPCGPFDDACTWHADEGIDVIVTFAPHALRFDLKGDGEGYFEIDAAGDATECRGACGVPLQQPLLVTIQYVSNGPTRTTLDPWTGCDDVNEAGTYCLVKVEGATTIGKTWRHPPIAADHTYTTNQGTLLTVPEADGVLKGVDDTPDDTHTASRLTEPDNGTLTLSADGSFTYEPKAGFAGVDTFTFRVTDAFGNTDDASADVTVRPRLRLDKLGNGSVSSAPAGIDCDTECSSDVAHFDLGSTVVLTADPTTGSTFDGWSGDACDGSSDLECAVTMSGPKSVTATFSANTYTLEVSRSGSGTGNVTSTPSGIDLSAGDTSATFDHGTEITLTATAAGNSGFAEWRTGPCAGSTSTTCTFTITDDTSVNARFTHRRLIIGVIGNGYGYLAGSSDGSDLDAAMPVWSSTTPFMARTPRQRSS